ncbi:MAG: hypothetical protein AAB131_14640 [Actinomycetota bacterium]
MKWYLVVSVAGAVHAVRRGRPARFAGLRFPGTPGAHALTIGTPLSAPPAMLIGLFVAARRQRGDVLKILSVLFVVGVAAEPDTLAALRHPSADPLSTGCTVLELVLPMAMLARLR